MELLIIILIGAGAIAVMAIQEYRRLAHKRRLEREKLNYKQTRRS